MKDYEFVSAKHFEYWIKKVIRNHFDEIDISKIWPIEKYVEVLYKSDPQFYKLVSLELWFDGTYLYPEKLMKLIEYKLLNQKKV